VTTPASNGGTSCPNPNGTTQACGINGAWSAWSPISCPTDCGKSASTQTRTCTNPTPSGGGAGCSGSATQNCAATAACVIGACATTHYNCNAGVSANNAEASPNWTWNCNSTNGGSNSACSEAIPLPTNFTSSCPLPGTVAHLSWTLPSGYSLSYFRVTDNTAGSNPNVWIPENVSDTGPATSFTTIPNHNYEAWVHTKLPSGSYSDPVYSNFTCTPANLSSITTATPTNITQTTATSGGTINSNGGATIITSGIVWSTSANPTYVFGNTTNQTTDGWATGGPWPDIMGGVNTGISSTPLSPSTTYHVRAYAINNIGTSYGSDVTFTTAALIPVNGVCGSGVGFANGKAYPYGTNSYGSDAQCSVGNPNITNFPTPGSSVGWQCSGSDGGNPSICSASQNGPSTSFDTSPPSIRTIILGTSVTLAWSSNAPSCIGTNFSTGADSPASGAASVAPSFTTTYTINCGGVSSSLTIITRKRPKYQEK